MSGQRIAVPGCDCPPHPRGNGFDLPVLEGTRAPGPWGTELGSATVDLNGCQHLGLHLHLRGGAGGRGGPQLGAESAGLTGLRLRLCRWIPSGAGGDESAPGTRWNRFSLTWPQPVQEGQGFLVAGACQGPICYNICCTASWGL